MQDLADHSIGLQKRIQQDLAEDDLPPQFKLFEDDGTMVQGATELLAAWKAKYTRDVERANAAYKAAQRWYLLLTNKDATSLFLKGGLQTLFEKPRLCRAS
ncbi:hypothetical protein ABBQ32_013215 [Trebouxia sp. C0010 RCD-2024]